MSTDRLTKQFEAFFAKDCVPIKSDEIVKPMRVIWMSPSGFFTGRLFPTEQRAFDFAEDLLSKGKKCVKVQRPDEPFPAQVRTTNRSFVSCFNRRSSWKKAGNMGDSR